MGCTRVSDTIKVETKDEAAYLAQNVANCSDGNFTVEWYGRVSLSSTIHLINHTKLSIQGISGAVIDGEHASQLFQLSSASLFLSNVTLENGSADEGAAILAEDSTVKLVDCDVAENVASTLRGGAFNLASSKLFLEGTVIFRENISNDSGGAVYIKRDTSILISGRTTFVSNSAERGAGIYVSSGCQVTVTGEVHFLNNTSEQEGGALHGADSNLTIESNPGWAPSSFVDNRAGSLGGAIYWKGSSDEVHPVSLSGVIISHNSAENGGAMFMSLMTAFLFDSCVFEANNASVDGGAVIIINSGSSDKVEVVSTVFQDNIAGENGGALVSNDGSVTFSNSTFAGNIAGNTGGAAIADSEYENESARLTMNGCVLSKNKARIGPALASAEAEVGRETLVLSSVVFEENTPLCGSDQFVDTYHNSSIAAESVAYGTSCFTCPDWSACADCSVSDPSTIYTCSDLLPYTTSPEDDGRLASLALELGYWRTSNASRDVRACHNAEACAGGTAEFCGGVDCTEGYCAAGYTGPYCAVCLANYTQGLGYTCYACDGDIVAGWEVAGICSALVLAVLGCCAFRVLTSASRPRRPSAPRPMLRKVASRLEKAIPSQAIKIAIVAWQIVTEFTAVANVSFPKYYRRLLSWVKALEFDAAWIASMGCHLRLNFYHRLLVVTLSPLVLLAFLAVTFLVSWRRFRYDGRAMRSIRRKHLAGVILVTFLIYSTASSLIFQTFVCDESDDGVSYLRADYSLECHVAGKGESSVHRGFMIYAGFMVLVYPLGIPMLYAFLLCTYSRWSATVAENAWDPAMDRTWEDIQRDVSPLSPNAEQHHQEDESMVVELWKPYKRDRYYYEVVECVRRVILTGVIVFVFPGSAAQISTTFLVALSFFIISEVLDPYAAAHHRWVYRFGHVVVMLSMFVALLVRVDLSGEEETDLDMYAVVLVISNATMALAVVGEAIVGLFEDGENDEVELVARVGLLLRRVRDLLRLVSRRRREIRESRASFDSSLSGFSL